MFGELRQHPEWRALLSHLNQEVDKAKDTVLNEVRRGSIPAAERAVGRHDVLVALIAQLGGED